MQNSTDIFISWSGRRSLMIANELAEYLNKMFPFKKTFLSSDMTPGGRWAIELAQTLEQSSFGLLCLTPDNLRAPWIMFEAGALSKTINARIVPLLFGCASGDMEGPLTQFQATEFRREAFKRLCLNLASAHDEDERQDFASKFTSSWAELNDVVNDILSQKIVEKPAYKGDKFYSPAASELCNISELQILKCIHGLSAEDNARLSIAYSALQPYIGESAKGHDNYLDFLFDMIIKRTTVHEPYVRENHEEQITIELPNPRLDQTWAGRKYLKWQRTVGFDVRSTRSRATKTYPIVAGTSCKVEGDLLEKFFADFEYIISVDNVVVFTWKECANCMNVGELMSGEPLDNDVCRVSFDAGVVEFTVRKDVKVAKPVSRITFRETSFIRYDENYYHFSARHPTRRLMVNVRLGPELEGWTIGEPSVGPMKYYPEDEGSRPTVRRSDREVSIHVPSWVLPGIVLVVEWAHPVDVESFFALL